jgi:hypothetical protein
MLAARIRNGAPLVNGNLTPTFNFTHSHGTVRLNISIVLDPNSFNLADDSDGTTDPNVRLNFRDARIGDDILRATNVEIMNIEPVDPSEGATFFTFRARIATKLPGTGEETIDEFKANSMKLTEAAATEPAAN